MNYYLAIDLGATSGRHVIGYLKDGQILLDEIHRFKTGMRDTKDGLVWDIPTFFNEIKIGIKKAFLKYKNITSMSIDTWGVDYVLLDQNDKDIPPYYAYRNKRNIKSAEKVHEIISFNELYKRTGIQFASFNTLYQLYDDLNKGRLDNAKDYLMLPSYFSYRLTGVKSHEYTNESTGALLNASTCLYDKDILNKLGLPLHLFKEIKKPGTILGYLKEEIAKEVGGNCQVILCPSHDTASAFEAVECDDDSIILSSGTWSLLGVKIKKPITSHKSLLANYTNEGGVNYIRYLKNIMGMWIVTQVCEQEELSFIDLQNRCNVPYHETFDVNDSSLLSPINMKEAIMKLLAKSPPSDDVELFNSIYHSLAIAYKKAIDELEEITDKTYQSIYVIGGGAKNNYLNSLIEKYTNKKVIALPIEATALGNIKTQMKVSKEL